MAARGRPGRPLPYSRFSDLISPSQKDRLYLLYFAFRYSDDGDDDGDNDASIPESQREKIDDDDDDKEGDDM